MSFYMEEFEGNIWVNHQGWSYKIPSNDIYRIKKSSTEVSASDGGIVSPMPGQVLKINVKLKDKVKAGQTLCVVEAMKMEHSLKSPFDGVIDQLHCKLGDSVSLGDLLLSVKK